MTVVILVLNRNHLFGWQVSGEWLSIENTFGNWVHHLPDKIYARISHWR